MPFASEPALNADVIREGPIRVGDEVRLVLPDVAASTGSQRARPSAAGHRWDDVYRRAGRYGRLEPGACSCDVDVQMRPDDRTGVEQAISHAGDLAFQIVDHIGDRGTFHAETSRGAGEECDQGSRQMHMHDCRSRRLDVRVSQ